VNVSSAQLRQIEAVLERLEAGAIPTPRMPGAIGMFLRQFAGARAKAQGRLGIDPPREGWISGESLMPVDLVPITPLELSLGNQIMGSVTSAVAASETLGSTVRVTLWGAARAAGRLLRIWRREPNAVVTLAGRYRWHPPSRITPGEASTESTHGDLHWHELRCLKYTGDDIGRPPQAAQFHPDWFTAPPGIKAFRTFAIRWDERWTVIPALLTTPPTVEVTVPAELLSDRDLTQMLVLAWTQPWEPMRWRALEAREATDDDVLAHNIVWADHMRELRGEGTIPGEEMRAMTRRLREVGLTNASIETALPGAQLTRRLSPRAVPFAAWLRGVT
jgi:hypothetical protein